MNASRCDETALEVILNDRTADPQFGKVVDHLSGCSACQQRLDDLTARPSVWHDTQRLLKEATLTEIPALPSVDTLVTAQVDSAEPVVSVDITPYLQPASHPEMLGRVGRYDVETEVGRGGMGIVLKAFDGELNRPVAIKVLAPHLASSGIARQRFVREARAAAAVVHENVVAIHGIETEGRLPSIVMEWVPGVSLQQYIDEHGAVDPVDAVRIGVQVAAGLSAAHAQGLVHRDIKPGNILLENSLNRVQITDFGLARAADDANLTHSGMIAGTPSFMAPEQALSDTVDHRSDLFSLGTVLYFAASGTLPFTAATPLGVMQQVCSATPRPLREINAAVPETLAAVVEKLQARQPADRFQTAEELHTWLNEYLAHLQQPTVRKAPPKVLTRRRLMQRRLGLVAGLGALLAGAVFVCGPLLFPSGPDADDVVAPQPGGVPGVATVEPGTPGAMAVGVTAGAAPVIISLDDFDEQLDELEHDVWEMEQDFDMDPSSHGDADPDDSPATDPFRGQPSVEDLIERDAATLEFAVQHLELTELEIPER